MAWFWGVGAEQPGKSRPIRLKLEKGTTTKGAPNDEPWKEKLFMHFTVAPFRTTQNHHNLTRHGLNGRFHETNRP